MGLREYATKQAREWSKTPKFVKNTLLGVLSLIDPLIYSQRGRDSTYFGGQVGV